MWPRSAYRLVALFLILVALPLGCANGTQPNVKRIDLKMRYSRFVPGDLTFQKGDVVEFVITNTDPIDHEFILGDEAVQQRHEFGTEAHHGAIPTEVSVPAGNTVTTRVTFRKAGGLIIGCHLPRHYDYGMKARVHVTV